MREDTQPKNISSNSSSKKLTKSLWAYIFFTFVGYLIINFGDGLELILYPMRSMFFLIYFSPIILAIFLAISLIKFFKYARILNIIFLWIMPILWIRVLMIDIPGMGLGLTGVYMYLFISSIWAIVWTTYFTMNVNAKRLYS